MTNQVEQAALNNALWINRICHLHNCSTQFKDGTWSSSDRTPPFHPNIVTTTPQNQGLIIAQQLLQANISGGFAIKDSFNNLDLSSLGFKTLFEAQWIYLEPTSEIVGQVESSSEIIWERITTPSKLTEWEYSWSRYSSTTQTIFLPELCREQDVLILGARLNGVYVAGCIANEDADCIGISNIFLPEENSRSCRRSFVEIIKKAFPGRPLVGYESGRGLREMLEVGFSSIGDLKVWYYESEDRE